MYLASLTSMQLVILLIWIGIDKSMEQTFSEFFHVQGSIERKKR